MGRAGVVSRVVAANKKTQRKTKKTLSLREYLQRHKAANGDTVGDVEIGCCYIPVMKGPWLSIALAVLLMVGGSIQCWFAFEARDYSTVGEEQNGTSVIDETTYAVLSSFGYVGPTFIGVGAFVLIVAVVVLLDQREKTIKEIMKQQQEGAKPETKELIYNTIMYQFSKHDDSSNGGSGGDQSRSLTSEPAPSKDGMQPPPNTAAAGGRNHGGTSAKSQFPTYPAPPMTTPSLPSQVLSIEMEEINSGRVVQPTSPMRNSQNDQADQSTANDNPTFQADGPDQSEEKKADIRSVSHC